MQKKKKKDKRWLVCEKCYNAEIYEGEQVKGIEASFMCGKINDSKIKRAVVRKNYDNGKVWGNYYKDICHCLKDGKCKGKFEIDILGQEDIDD